MSKSATLGPSSWSRPATLCGDRDGHAYWAVRLVDVGDETAPMVGGARTARAVASRTGRLLLETALAVALACWGADSAVQDAMASSSPAPMALLAARPDLATTMANELSAMGAAVICVRTVQAQDGVRVVGTFADAADANAFHVVVNRHSPALVDAAYVVAGGE